jgi:hypothetical protein
LVPERDVTVGELHDADAGQIDGVAAATGR